MKVAVSVLNWQNWVLAAECVESLLALEDTRLTILLRDNASPNDSFNRLRVRFPQLVVARSECNDGFAAGHQQNLELAQKLGADAFWLLNSDASVQPETLDRLLEAWGEFGTRIYGSVSLRASDPSVVDFGGTPWTEKSSKWLTYDSWKGRAYKDLLASYPESYESEAVQGCSMFLPMELVAKHGFMKEDFFMYAEETDYCYRLRQAGIAPMVVTRSVVLHMGEGSSSAEKGVKAVPTYYRRRNEVRFACEHLGMRRRDLLFSRDAFRQAKLLAKRKVSGVRDADYYQSLAFFHSIAGVKGRTLDPARFCVAQEG
jgi:GT2 family glycosyltransferase